MTDEEMAEARATTFADINYNEPDNYGTEKEIGYHAYYCGFLAGLKAGKDMAEADLAAVAYMQGAERYKPKWHKVADGDLPKETEFIESDVLLLLVQLKGTENKRYELGRYIFSGNEFSYTHLKFVEDVVAWCEIPIFTEENI